MRHVVRFPDPAEPAAHKIKKTEGVPTIALTRNPDILLDVAREREKTGMPAVVVGFAAESQDLLQNARTKLERKGLSMIVANDIAAADAGFAVDTNRVTVLADNGTEETLPLMSKAAVAEQLVERIANRLGA